MISMSSQKFFSWPGTNEEQRNLANISAASEISNLETMPKQKTFRYDIEHLKKSLHLRTDVGEGDKANIYNNAHVLRLKASISGPLNKHTVKGIKPISIPRAFEEDVASAVELAKARSHGRTTMYRMARPPYYRGPSTLSKKFVKFDSGRSRSSVLYDLRSGSNGSKMARKRRSSVLDDQDWLVRWVEFGQKLSLFSRKFSIRATNQMASKILEHLERTSPKEKNSSSRVAGTTEKSANKLTSNLALGSLDKVESSKFLLSSQNNQKSEGSAPTTNASSTLALRAEPRQKKPAFQMSVHEYFEVLDDDNHSTARVQGNAPTTNAASTLALPAEPPQKKPAFQMSVPEDFDVLDDDNHSTAPVQVNAPTTYAARSLALPRIYLEYDIEHLKKSLHLRTDVGEGDKANIYNNAHVLRLKASISGPLNKHTVKGIKPISIPRAFEEDVASAVELAKARSRGRTTMYRMARPPYYRGPSTLSKKFVKPTTTLISSQPAWELEGSNGSKMFDSGRSRSSVLYDLGSGGPMHRIRPKANFHPTPLLISSQPAWELEGSNGSKMARKRRSSVLDDLGSGGPMCRIWQKANLCSQGSSLSEHKSEFVSSALNLLLCSEPERKASKAIVENGKTSMRNSGYAFVPTQSTQMASKILEHLERTSPKEKNSSSRLAGTTEKSANKLTKSNHQIPLIVLSSMNGNSTARVKGSAPTTNASSTLALRAEPRQKKPAFQMSVHEYFEVLDDDNHSTARVQGNAPTTNAASTLALPAEPPQKKPAFQMSVPEDFDVLDDDNHSTAPVQVNAPTTYAARSLALPRIYLEYDDPPQKKLRLSFSYNQ
ncbi:hypothetical protein Tco_0304058 [Tanacetum coccineum]